MALRQASSQASNATKAAVFDDVGKGCVLSIPDHKHGEPWCVVQNMEPAPGGAMQVRSTQTAIPMLDPSTLAVLGEDVISLIPVERQAMSMAWLVVTASYLWRLEPQCSTFNLSLLHTWTTAVEHADWCSFLNRLYVATGTNYLLEWDGAASPSYVSSGWWTGYTKPATVCVYEGLLVVGGFRDVAGASPNSELATTGAEDASALIDAPLVVASRDTDQIVGVAPTPWGLLVGKSRNTYRVLGSTFSLTDSDLDVALHTPLAGFVGPRAWCSGPSGETYFMDKRGIFMATNPVDAALEISLAISPVFGSTLSHSQVNYPKAGSDLSGASMAYDPIHRKLVVSFPGVSA